MVPYLMYFEFLKFSDAAFNGPSMRLLDSMHSGSCTLLVLECAALDTGSRSVEDAELVEHVVGEAVRSQQCLRDFVTKAAYDIRCPQLLYKVLPEIPRGA